MTEQDIGNATTQKIYQLATEPIFASDHSLDKPNVSWEVADGNPPPLPIEDSPQVEDGEFQEEETESPPEPLRENTEDSTSDEEEEEKEKIKKKNRTSEKKRISDLTRQLKQAQAVAQDVLTRNQYLETKLTEKHKEALTTEENLLTSQKERVKQYLTDAIEEGDPAKIAEANDLLSQYNAEIQLKKSQKSNLQPIPSPSYNPPSPLLEDSYDDNQEEGLAWLDKNTWANPKSEDFDQDLYNFADQYSIKLAKKYTIQGKKSEIGSPKFWNEITSYINSTFEVNDQESSPSLENTYSPSPHPKGRTPMKTQPSNPVSPVTRQSLPGDPPKKANDIVLSPEQREAAHAMRGYVRDPKTGQKITDNKTLEEIYKRNLRMIG